MKTKNTKVKPEAFMYDEGHGCFTKNCKTKEEAHNAMLELLHEEWEEDGKLTAYFEKEEDIEVNIDGIKSDWMYCNHKKCGAGYWTIGEAICEECGETINAQGRSTFTYEF